MGVFDLFTFKGKTSESGNTSADQDGSWVKDMNTGRWSYGNSAENTWCRNAWKKIQGVWYRFDQDGYMITGWYQDPAAGRWYYLDDSGAMVTGERKIDGKVYRFAEGPEDMAGVMLQ